MSEKVWDVLERTDPKYTKAIDGKGFKGTAINPTYCYKKMTQAYGQIGIGWKFETTKSETVQAPDGQLLLYKEIKLYTKNGDKWSDPIEGCGGEFIIKKNKHGLIADDEAHKKVTTDALTNAMKFLGMSADVHMGLYDDNKYINQVTEEFGEPKEHNREDKMKQRDMAYDLALAKTVEDVDSFLSFYDPVPDFISDAAANKKTGLRNNVLFPPAKYGFIDVEEALAFGVLARKNIEEGPIDGLEDWMVENDAKIKGLDSMLKAAKYNKDGSPSDRLFRAYENRTKLLAAE